MRQENIDFFSVCVAEQRVELGKGHQRKVLIEFGCAEYLHDVLVEVAADKIYPFVRGDVDAADDRADAGGVDVFEFAEVERDSLRIFLGRILEHSLEFDYLAYVVLAGQCDDRGVSACFNLCLHAFSDRMMERIAADVK